MNSYRKFLDDYFAKKSEVFKCREQLDITWELYEKSAAQKVLDEALLNDLSAIIENFETSIATLQNELTPHEEKAAEIIDLIAYNPRVRLIMQLRYLHGFPWDLVGGYIGLSAAAAKNSVYRAWKDFEKRRDINGDPHNLH